MASLSTRFHPRASRLFAGVVLLLAVSLATSCNRASTASPETTSSNDEVFPKELVSFVPYKNNPVFTGTAENTWDHDIRERGYIVKEGDGYHMWYTGFRGDRKDPVMTLGYATSGDGIEWTRFRGNPIFTESWVEDMIEENKSSGILVHDGERYRLYTMHDQVHLHFASAHE